MVTKVKAIAVLRTMVADETGLRTIVATETGPESEGGVSIQESLEVKLKF